MANQNNFSNVKTYNGETPVQKNAGNISALTQMLADNMKALKSVLPKHITPERIARVGLNTIRRNPKLCQCAPQTLLAAIMECATLGLEIDSRGQAYLVPYWNKNTKSYDVSLIIGYKGMLDLAYRSGKIASIMSEVVCENDKFVINFGLEPKLEHSPALRNRGEIVASYAIAIMKDGSKQFAVMLKDDLDKIRKSATSESGPWSTWEAEMCKKSVLKRICKLLPLSPEIQKATSLDDLADAGMSQTLGESLYDIDVPQQEIPVQDDAEYEAKKQEMPASDMAQIKNIICPKNKLETAEEVCQKCADFKVCPEWEAI